VGGKVERPEHGHDTVGTKLAGAGALRRHFGEVNGIRRHAFERAFGGCVERDIDFACEQAGFGFGVPRDLASFSDEQLRQCVYTLGCEFLKCSQHGDAAFHSKRVPRRLSSFGG
jgi:hypothetical protein